MTNNQNNISKQFIPQKDMNYKQLTHKISAVFHSIQLSKNTGNE
jgi:hypothetical protein